MAGTNTGRPAGAPAERILQLAAYAKEKRGAISLDDIVADVPGYRTERGGPLTSGTAEWETLRKRLSRDIADLKEHLGIDFAYDDVEHSYALRPPFFTAEERGALVAAAATVTVVGIDSVVPGALGSAVDDSSAQIVLRVHDLVATLRNAISTRTAVRFRHENRARSVLPFAIGTWRTHWYLAGNDRDENALRRFRLDRIEGQIATEGAPGAYAIPDDFDVETAFDLDPNVWGTDPLAVAHVRVALDHVDAFQRELGGDLVERDDEDAIVELEVRHYVSFRNRLLLFRGAAVVLEPPVLVDGVRDHLVALAGHR